MNESFLTFERRGAVGLVTLDRPEALNALNRDMCVAMAAHLAQWAGDASVCTVVVRGSGRAFCAGGDMRAVYHSVREGSAAARDFFRDEYRLNRAIRHFPKPYVALLHGFVMGGGAGISVHGSHRAAGESLAFAMPETGIGMFPDVGASYFLSRAPGGIGLYLALTGAVIGTADALHAGLATHFIPVARWDVLIERLAAGQDPDEVLAVHAAEPETSALAARRGKIDVIFAAPTVEAILERLEREGCGWALDLARTIRARSPFAGKLALRAIRAGADLDFDSCMAMEFRLACRITATHDLAEGIRALLIDKDRAPKWNPPSFAGIEDEKILALFAPSNADGL